MGIPGGRWAAFLIGLAFAVALLLGAGWLVATWMLAVPLLAGAYRTSVKRERGM
jgi:hypothetical protein